MKLLDDAGGRAGLWQWTALCDRQTACAGRCTTGMIDATGTIGTGA